MRIVAGKYKNKTIIAPEGLNTRPSSDRTRESIFNIVAKYVYDSNVLDIFSGSGALAIEAYSRGAKKITLIDNDKNAINCINNNLKSLKIDSNYNVIYDSYKIISKLNEQFDLILLDPPYNLDVFDEIFKMIIDNNLLSDYGVIVYESNVNHSLKNNYEGFTLKVYKYGIAYVNVLFKN